MNTLLVTGSCGLIGSEIVGYFCRLGWQVNGVDNNQRAEFFGPEGDTTWNRSRLIATHPTYRHLDLDIRNRDAIAKVVHDVRPDLVMHAAAQPSHDLAASRVFDDFDVNAVGTLNLLEAVRKHAPEAVFVHMSTNKVYGDRPNSIRLRELETRWDYDDPAYTHGIAEDFPVDQSLHSLFGASKLAADILVQEYGRYYGLATCCLRAGCLTGPNHSGVELHGFLSYLVKCHVIGKPYRVYGYCGKQVRDNLHSFDVATFVHAFWKQPRSGEVYNLGGGRDNSCSILEAFARVETLTGRRVQYEYVDRSRTGDHICYISDLRKAQAHHPGWRVTKTLDAILLEILRRYEPGASKSLGRECGAGP